MWLSNKFRRPLSYYDNETISCLSSDKLAQTLVFYDVTLVRKAGESYVGYKVLFTISDILARFMDENEDAVLCFYCDADTDVRRNHMNMLPQEYRSHLFSRMFEIYMKSKSQKTPYYINHRIAIEDSNKPGNRQFAHFICRKEHETAVADIGQLLMHK